jgi:two-component system chemotaxis response regulator CheY
MITRQRILVVDDDPSIRDMCSMVLRDDEGYEVQTAVDGQDAIDHLGCAPDLILLDIGMPLMDGREFVRRLRSLAKFRSTPVLVMTAQIGAADVVGSQGTIRKPFDVEALLGRVANLLPAAA